ncbi:MAG TPA: hypothetical protein VGE94_00505 [Chloroflexota bacterium]|jgi:4,5-dihydroxyphthalate decarboxylase
MTKLQLSLIMAANGRTRPILNGATTAEGIDLTCTVGHPSEIFWRQLHFAEFDVSEMSMSSLLMLAARGKCDWVALPVFTTRHFFHTWAWCRTDAGISSAADLRGKRVGVPEYQQTAAVWSRGVLKHEFGVDAKDVEWFMERTPELSHGGATGFEPPAGVRVNRIAAESSIGTMLLNGDLDATLMYINDVNVVDRSRVSIEGRPEVRQLFENPQLEGRRYFQKTGIFPINHTLVVRRSILEQHPWVALNLVNAFERAKEAGAAAARELIATQIGLGRLPEQATVALAADPYPYGIKANRTVLETLLGHMYEQGLIARRPGLDEVFAPSTLQL